MPKALPPLPRRNAAWTPLQRRAWLADQRHQKRLLTAQPVPATPTNLTAADISTAIQLAWTTVTDGTVTGYHIYRKVDAGSFTLYRTVGASASPQQDTAVVMASNYYYYLTAYNAFGESAPSAVVSLTFGAA